MITKFKDLEANFTITKAATIVGILTLLAKLVSAVRDPLFAAKFGGPNIYVLDVYNAAFRIPDFVFNIFILGTLSVALIPVFVDLRVKDERRAQDFANSILSMTMLVMGVIFLALFAFAYPITKMLVPHFSPALLDQTVRLSRLIILSQIIFTLSNICTNILYSYKRFIIAGIAPIMYNLGIICGIVLLYPRFGIMGLGYGVLLGAFLHLLIQLPELRRISFHLRLFWHTKDEAIMRFWKLYVPRIFVIDLSIFSLLIGTFIASGMQTGSIGILTLAINLQTIAVSIVALSLATAIFPALSEAYAEGNQAKFLDILKKTIIQIFYFMVPLTILMLIFRAQAIRLYLGHGNFNWSDTVLTFQTFGVLTFSLLSQSLIPIFARAFYSRQNTKTPVVINLLALALEALLSFVFGRLYGIAGIAWAFSLASIFNALALFIFLRIDMYRDYLSLDFFQRFDNGLFPPILKITVASVIMGLVSRESLFFFVHFFNNRTTLGLLLQVGASGLVGVAVFIALSSMLKLKESRLVLDYVRRLLFMYR